MSAHSTDSLLIYPLIGDRIILPSHFGCLTVNTKNMLVTLTLQQPDSALLITAACSIALTKKMGGL
jgi:hypothetical protein